MASRAQLKWSQLRVGITVIVASSLLALLIFLLTGAQGLFVRKIILRSYFQDTSGLRIGAPVRLQGVAIGNVTNVRISRDHPTTPVEVIMRVSTRYEFDLHKDSTAMLSTAGVLGEEFVNINSTGAKGPSVSDGDILPTAQQPQISDVVAASQGTLQSAQALLARADRIMGYVESGQGSIGKLIYDDQLYRQLNASVAEVQQLINQINSGKGSVGKFITSDEMYQKVNRSLDQVNDIIGQINSGQGAAGKFIKDPSLYNNANDTIAKANLLVSNINSGKGTLGKLASDEAFARKLDDTVTQLSQLTTKINSGQGTVGKFVNDPALFDNANAAIVETRNLIEAVRKDPKRYLTIHFRIF